MDFREGQISDHARKVGHWDVVQRAEGCATSAPWRLAVSSFGRLHLSAQEDWLGRLGRDHLVQLAKLLMFPCFTSSRIKLLLAAMHPINLSWLNKSFEKRESKETRTGRPASLDIGYCRA
jgi:hypothetical protein